jgi:MSHA biogenesis protein MshJ
VKAALKHAVERLDAATLRERVLVFIAAASVLLFTAHAAFIAPLRAQQARLAAQSEQQQKELRSLQASLQKLALQAAGQDPDAANRARQAQLRAELKELNGRIEQEQRRFTAPERMRAVLEEMLERNRRLALVDLRTLAPVPIGAAKAGPGGTPGLYRHGIELTVSGTYPELYDYLRALEHLPTQLYWGRAELVVAAYPTSTLKLTVYTVSFDRAWLIV